MKTVILDGAEVAAVPCECGDASCMLCDDDGYRAMMHQTTEFDPMHWIRGTLEKRNQWFGKRSGRRIEEALDRVLLFERGSDKPIVEVWVEQGNIEKAKLEALTIALSRDENYGAVP